MEIGEVILVSWEEAEPGELSIMCHCCLFVATSSDTIYVLIMNTYELLMIH